MPILISKRNRVTVDTYALFFANDSEGMSGFSVDCTSAGVIIDAALNDCTRETLTRLQNGSRPYAFSTIQNFSHSYTEPAVIECEGCPKHVHLHGFTNTCGNCGADYNMSGVRLADRSSWSDDTGESVSDILQIK